MIEFLVVWGKWEGIVNHDGFEYSDVSLIDP